MQEGVHLTVGVLRPAGYPMLLRVLEPFHSLVLITTLQHLMGIAVAAIVYGLLRKKGLPGWGACPGRRSRRCSTRARSELESSDPAGHPVRAGHPGLGRDSC